MQFQNWGMVWHERKWGRAFQPGGTAHEEAPEWGKTLRHNKQWFSSVLSVDGLKPAKTGNDQARWALQARDEVKGRFTKFNQWENGFEEERKKSRKTGWGVSGSSGAQEWRSALDGVSGLGKERTDTRNAVMEESIRFDNGLDVESLPWGWGLNCERRKPRDALKAPEELGWEGVTADFTRSLTGSQVPS